MKKAETDRQTRLTDTLVVNRAAANSLSAAGSADGDYVALLTDRTGKWEI